MGALSGKVAWVTGGGTGIGRAGALALAEDGCKVVISGRSDATLDETASLIRHIGGSVEIRKLDVANKKAVARVAAAIEKKHGHIDILVNSAGTNIPDRRWAVVTTEGWEEVVRTNLDGMFYCCHAVLPGMRKRRDGVVINISSWFGKFVTPLAGPSYTASKFGAAALTETINAEDGLQGVRACVICPAEVATPILNKTADRAAPGRAGPHVAGGGPRAHHRLRGGHAAARLRQRDHHQPDLQPFLLRRPGNRPSEEMRKTCWE